MTDKPATTYVVSGGDKVRIEEITPKAKRR